MTDFRATAYSQAGREVLAELGQDITDAQMNAILNGLDAAGLLLTPDRLDAIAETIKAVDTDDRDARWGLDCAAAIVRHSMSAVTS